MYSIFRLNCVLLMDLWWCIILLQYNFEGRFSLVRFLKTVHQAGLYAHLRIGPYACAEWNYGYAHIYTDI